MTAARAADANELHQLTEVLIAIAGGDFDARAPRSGSGDTLDVLSYMVNNVAAEVGGVLAERDRHRAQLAAILDAMADGVLVLGATGRVEHTNPALERLLGRASGTTTGVALRDLLLHGDVADTISEAVAAEGRWASTVLFRHADPGGLPLSVNASLLPRGANQAPGMVLVARDEQPFAEAAEKVRLYTELRRAQAQLVQSAKLASLGELAGAVSHEINNPLQVLSGLVNFLRDDLGASLGEDPRFAEWHGDTKEMLAAIARCSDISRRLLAFARGSGGDHEDADLRRICLDTLDLTRRMIANRDVQLTVDLPDPLPVAGNTGQLGQIILNLLLNALDAVGPGGHLKVGGMQAEDRVRVDVTDDGHGVSPEHIARVFDPFFTTKGPDEGTGLGLSVSYGIAEAHGGRLEASSDGLGHGATFSLVLPVRND